MPRTQKIESGLPGLDKVLQGIRLGESIVWQISNIDNYMYFVKPLAKKAIATGRNIIYFRFAEHPPLLDEQEGLRIIHINPDLGFEPFTVTVNKVIYKEGPKTYYIFDSLSELQSEWAADFMMRNFFKALCPSIRELGSVAYFSIMRQKHSYKAIQQVREAADIYINALDTDEGMYVHPLKVGRRHTDTMFLPHLFTDKEGNELIPLKDGISTSKYYSKLGAKGIANGRRNLDNWDLFFMRANSAINQSQEKQAEIKDKVYRILIGRDKKRESLFKENFNIQDYLDINDRLIGSGSIGGKAAGMLLARKIIENNRPDLSKYIEPHDSFYIGTSVFYTFLISNNWWKLWLEHKSSEGYFLAARALKSQLIHGDFPELVQDYFKIMLDHFGQNPIIVRSSSFLEDGFGNAFAGKYESVFCVNKGTPEERYEDFVKAVKEVYASALDESALVYRQSRGLDKADEQMSILVQRVSGSIFDDIYMPSVAGVAYSTNTYVWNEDIDADAGLVRIVAGLGTRAVDRISNDYPRIASLDKPSLKPSAKKFTQKYIDVLNLNENYFETIRLEDIVSKLPSWYQRMIIEHDREAEELLREKGIEKDIIFTTCDSIINNEEIVTTLREILSTIHDHYNYPVDVEFTINFSQDGDFLINLVQCRPLQAKGSGAQDVSIPTVSEDKTFFHLKRGTMGGPVSMPIDLVAIVDGKGYYDLPYNSKYSIPREIEMINKYAREYKKSLMLIGPGRWGTSSPDLGVPVRFAQISNVSALCETSFENDLMPELSFGSHFFQDLVESNIFYAAIFDRNFIQGEDSVYRPEIFDRTENIYTKIPSVTQNYTDVIRVYDTSTLKLYLVANSASNEAICYIK